MPRQTGEQLREQLDASFEDFRQALTAALTAEAKQTIDDKLAKLSSDTGPFSVEGFEVEVVIRNLSISSGDRGSGRPAPAKAPRRKSGPAKGARRAGQSSSRRGRPDGPIRTAVLEVFARDPHTAIRVADLHETLEADGVSVKSDNLHQQLRRLVAAGALKRVDRGTYQAAAVPPSD